MRRRDNIPEPPPTRTILSVAEVRSIMRVGENTVLKLIWDKKLPAKRVGKRWLIRRVDVENYLNPHAE